MREPARLRTGRGPGKAAWTGFFFAAGLHAALLLSWPAIDGPAVRESAQAIAVRMNTVRPNEPAAAPPPAMQPAPRRPAPAAAPASAAPLPAQTVPADTPRATAETRPSPAPAPEEAQAAPPDARPVDISTAYLHNPRPEYPAMSRRLGEQGRVLLQVRVGADGRVLELEVARSCGFPRLDAAARRSVAAWRFVPATVNGTAIESSVLVPVVFSLES